MKYLPGDFIEVAPSYGTIFPMAQRANAGEEVTEGRRKSLFFYDDVGRSDSLGPPISCHICSSLLSNSLRWLRTNSK